MAQMDRQTRSKKSGHVSIFIASSSNSEGNVQENESDSSIDEEDARIVSRAFSEANENVSNQLKRSMSFIGKYTREANKIRESVHDNLVKLTQNVDKDQLRHLRQDTAEKLKIICINRLEVLAEAEALKDLVHSQHRHILSEIEKLEANGFNNKRYVREKNLRKEQRKQRSFHQVGDNPSISDNSTYCLCNQLSYGEMVACDNKACRFEWFHLACVGLSVVPNGKWYCPICSKKRRRRR